MQFLLKNASRMHREGILDSKVAMTERWNKQQNVAYKK